MGLDDLPADAFATALDRLRQGSQQYFGVSSIEIRPLQRRDGPHSTVLQARVLDGSRTWSVFLKSSTLEDGQRQVIAEFETLRRTREALASVAGLTVVRPIACFPVERTLVTEEAPGRTLHNLLNRPRLWRFAGRSSLELIRVFERVGLWLKAFQKTRAPSGKVSLQDMREDLRVRLDRLVDGSSGFTAADRSALLAYFDAHCEEVRECDLALVPVHGDFCPDNVLAQGTNITVIDFSTARTGAVLHDLTHLFMHLEKLKMRPWMGVRVVEELQRAMLRTFDPTLDPHRPQFQLLALRHLVCQLLSSPDGSMARELYRWYISREHRRRLRTVVYWQSPTLPA